MSEIHTQLRRAGLIAGAAYLAQAPYLVYLARVAYPDAIRERFKAIPTEELLALDLMRVALVVVLASLVGSFFSEKNGLPGLGDRTQLRRAVPWIFGGLSAGLLFHGLGGEVVRALPGQFPCELKWALVAMLKAAVFDEIVARYGMMTLMTGVLRRPQLANVLQAVFFAGVGARALFFDGGGGGPGLDPITIASLITSLGVALLCGHVYLRFGLIAAILVHLAVGVRFVAHAVTC